jgi:hypothetical protein
MFRLNLEQYRPAYDLAKIILATPHIEEKLSFTHYYILYCIIYSYTHVKHLSSYIHRDKLLTG